MQTQTTRRYLLAHPRAGRLPNTFGSRMVSMMPADAYYLLKYILRTISFARKLQCIWNELRLGWYSKVMFSKMRDVIDFCGVWPDGVIR